MLFICNQKPNQNYFKFIKLKLIRNQKNKTYYLRSSLRRVQHLSWVVCYCCYVWWLKNRQRWLVACDWWHLDCYCYHCRIVDVSMTALLDWNCCVHDVMQLQLLHVSIVDSLLHLNGLRKWNKFFFSIELHDQNNK